MRCCHTHGDPAARATSAPTRIRARWTRRTASLLQWAIPLTTLALIPKCPICLAGYIMLFTGAGVSFSAAATTRWVLIVLSITAITYLIVRAVRRAS